MQQPNWQDGQSENSAPTEFTVDIDMSEVRKDVPQSGRGGMYQPAHYDVEIVGAQFLCPKCMSALYVKGKNMPDGREITVHWDDMVESSNDGLFRPTISIEGVLKCDYYDFERISDGKFVLAGAVEGDEVEGLKVSVTNPRTDIIMPTLVAIRILLRSERTA